MKFEHGAMSSRFECEAENKLTAYAVICMHYDRSAHLVALYEPKKIVENDQWINPLGAISERLDEVFKGASGLTFDEYAEKNIEDIKRCWETRKKLV